MGLFIGLFVCHVLAIMAVFFSAILLIIQIMISMAIVISFIIYLKRQSHELSIQYCYSGQWGMFDANNHFQLIEVLSSTVISSFLIVFRFKTQSKQKKTILICKDAMLHDQYRRLLVTLKIRV